MNQEDPSSLANIIMLLVFILPLVFTFVFGFRASQIKKKLLASEERNKEVQAKNNELVEKLAPITDIEEEVHRISEKSKADVEKAVLTLIDSKKEAEKIISDGEVKAKDIENSAEQVLEKANIKAIEIKDTAEQVLDDAKNEAKDMRSASRTVISDAKLKAEDLIKDGRKEADQAIAYANVQAQEIAGEALEAKRKSDIYESAIKAMKNTIEGYKDDYIVPNHSVLDDLAEEYSHKEAGEQLKLLRKRVKEMVKGNRAGDCDYVEANRKAYAIHFAVDAFNGKVDSALSKVKQDNFGKIKQEIIDAYALVNHNGAPFRSARILQEFLDARLDELKWAVATHELRQKELAEQKAIRDQIREEEKARREMEKAIKDAEKEERVLQKALEKARKELASASEEQKQQYEAQLAELEGKLSEAEEKGQRAISMAQQTKRGHVYVISNIGSFGEEVFKVGMTRRLEPMDRVKELGDASVPFSFDVHAMMYSDDAPALEKSLHRLFDGKSVNKINPRKEFFRLPLSEIKKAVEIEGVEEVHWTMKAEAAEYRESISIVNANETRYEKDLLVES